MISCRYSIISCNCSAFSVATINFTVILNFVTTILHVSVITVHFAAIILHFAATLLHILVTAFSCDYSLTIHDYFLVTCLLKQQYNWRENNLLIINSSFVSLVLLCCGCDSLVTKLILHEWEGLSNIIQASVLHTQSM